MSTTPTPPMLRTLTDSGIRTILADNPGRLNAYTRDMWEALPKLFREAEADPEVRVIVLRGAGTKAFSAGADISEFEGNRTGAEARRYDEINHEAFEAVGRATKPTIAMVYGYCFGGGCELAMCCDMRWVADDAVFSIPCGQAVDRLQPALDPADALRGDGGESKGDAVYRAALWGGGSLRHGDRQRGGAVRRAGGRNAQGRARDGRQCAALHSSSQGSRRRVRGAPRKSRLRASRSLRRSLLRERRTTPKAAAPSWKSASRCFGGSSLPHPFANARNRARNRFCAAATGSGSRRASALASVGGMAGMPK